MDRGALLELASWRWIFRFLACVSLALAVPGYLLFPRNTSATSSAESLYPVKFVEILKTLDPIGVVTIMACLLLFNLALTSMFS